MNYIRKTKKNLILNGSKQRMVGYRDWQVVFLSVFQTETEKLVNYAVIGICH